MAGITYTKAQSAPAGGVAIGDPVTGGTDTNVLFINPAEILAQDPRFLFDPATGKFTAPILNTDNDINFIDGQLKSDGAGTLTNNFPYNFFPTGPLGLGTLLAFSVFTLEGVRTVEQTFFTSAPAFARIGQVQLVLGVGTFAATWITAGHFAFACLVTPFIGSYGPVTVAITPGIGVTLTSSNPADASIYNIIIFNTF